MWDDVPVISGTNLVNSKIKLKLVYTHVQRYFAESFVHHSQMAKFLTNTKWLQSICFIYLL